MKAIRTLVVCAAAAMLLAWAGCAEGMREGSLAPDFELTNLTGQRASLSQYRGRVVLLVFWAVGGDDSQVLAADLKELQERHARDLRVVAVHVWADVPRAQIARFVEDQQLPYTLLTGGGEVFEEQYSNGEIPRLYLLDREGRIRHTSFGWQPEDRDKYERRIARLVGRDY